MNTIKLSLMVVMFSCTLPYTGIVKANLTTAVGVMGLVGIGYQLNKPYDRDNKHSLDSRASIVANPLGAVEQFVGNIKRPMVEVTPVRGVVGKGVQFLHDVNDAALTIGKGLSGALILCGIGSLMHGSDYKALVGRSIGEFIKTHLGGTY